MAGVASSRTLAFAAPALHAAAVFAAWTTWPTGWWPVAVACWPVIAWLNHAGLVRLHEAVHRQLARSRVANELLGVGIGTLSLTPMSVYRDVHTRHHAHLAGPEDPEFWPYNLPRASRVRRIGLAWAELLFGFVVTPALYSLRTARAWPRHRPLVRRRLLLEWLLLAVFWFAVLAAVQRGGAWPEFAAAVLVPAWLTGVGQTLRKFGEHLGLAGDSVLTATRTVVADGALGRLLSWSQRRVDHHGTHHRWPHVPFRALPAASAAAVNAEPGRWYRSHGAALGDALRHLANPRVGPQWLAAGKGAGMAAADEDRLTCARRPTSVDPSPRFSYGRACTENEEAIDEQVRTSAGRERDAARRSNRPGAARSARVP